MLTKWNPFVDLEKFERVFNRAVSGSGFMPAMDVFEDREKITIEAEVPGYGPEDIDITLDKGILTIKSTKKRKYKTEGREYWRVERCEGAFARSFHLPSSVDSDNVQATYDRGVLIIHVLKKPEIVPKKIEIKSTG